MVSGYFAGRTAIMVKIDVYAERRAATDKVEVTEATFTYVAIGEDGRPRIVPCEAKKKK